MQSVFAAVRLLHGRLTLAYFLQGADRARRGRRALLAAAAPLPRPRRRAGDGRRGAARQPVPARLRSDPAGDPAGYLRAKGCAAVSRPAKRACSPSPMSCRCSRAMLAGGLGLPLAPLTIAAVFYFVAAARRGVGTGAGPQAIARRRKIIERTIIGAAANRSPRATRDDLAPAPGKTCGPCTMCCSALEIPELKKPAGPACEHCASGGCAIYASRPQVCRDFECDWLTDRTLPSTLRPDRVGTILMEADDGDEYRAVCAPKSPWPGATRWFRPSRRASPSPDARWSPRPASIPGGFLLRANGGRPSEHVDYFFGAPPMI